MSGGIEEVLERFIQRRPISVMARAVMERILSPEWAAEVFEKTARVQYTRTLLFSTVFELMVYVVLRVKPSVHAASQALGNIGVSLKSLYNKLAAMEPAICAALVRDCGQKAATLIEQMGGQRQSLLAGYRIKIIDGNAIAATEHRLKELRPIASGALPGKSIVVYDVALDVVIDVFPCEDGHTQERALLGAVLNGIETNDVIIADRNFCVSSFLWGIHQRGAFFIIRHHANLALTELTERKKVGCIDTGVVDEQFVEIDNGGNPLVLRCITLRLHKPTRDGDRELRILTDLPCSVADALLIARLYAGRWRIETAFQRLERDLHTELNTLGFPKAALFGFCIGLIAFNLMAIVHAALRAVHGEQKIDTEFSSYFLALELQGVREGMMVAVPEQSWFVFRAMPQHRFVSFLLDLSRRVELARFKKHPRGPKKPQPPRVYDPSTPHVSTAKLLAARKRK
jgi:IS4 transposase